MSKQNCQRKKYRFTAKHKEPKGADLCVDRSIRGGVGEFALRLVLAATHCWLLVLFC